MASWLFQGDRLARRLRIIGVDQRGTLRSGLLPAAAALTADLLIADFEALREQLEIASWAVRTLRRWRLCAAVRHQPS